MSKGEQVSDPILPFADFLDHLRRQGFTIGVDHHLRLRALLNSAGAGCAPADVKTLICPIFATSAHQQELFYRLFEEYFPYLSAAAGPVPAAAPATTRRAPGMDAAPLRRWPYFAAAALALIACVAFLTSKTQTWLYSSKTSRPSTAPPSAGGTTQQPAGSESLAETAGAPGHAHVLGHEVSANVRRLPSSYAPALAWYADHRFALGWTVLWGPPAFWLAYEAHRFRRRRLRIRRNSGKTPPYSVTITTGPPPAVYEPHEIAGAARLLHRRQAAEADRLDVEASVAASIGALGFPTFRYRKDTRLPEYLLLIDRASFRDHQASLYQELAELLREQGLFVTTYFFEGDPRTCWSASAEQAVRLEQLQPAFAGQRLLIFGDGERLLDPLTGRLPKWAFLFTTWGDRALLTPEPPSEWGMREAVLEKEFPLFPATLEGLAALSVYFDLRSRPDPKRWRWRSAPSVPDGGGASEVSLLRRHLGEAVFQWVCACAVYPELHWNLTLHLAQLPSLPRDLLSEENVLTLLRLRCFRAGWMRDELRRELLAHIDPRIEREAREWVVGFLERTETPAGTYAEDRRQFQLAYHRYWGNPRDRKARQRLRGALENAAIEDAAQDYAYLDATESVSRSPLVFMLPSRLRRRLFPARMPWFGPRTAVRAAVAILTLAGLLQGLRALDRRLAAETDLYRRLYSGSLGLSIREVAGSLRIRWAPKAQVIERSVGGVLRIADGEGAGHYDLALTKEQLDAGSATYSPKSRTIAVSLTLMDERDNAVSEFTHIQLPPPSVRSPLTAEQGIDKDRAPVRIAGKVFQAPLRPANSAPMLVPPEPVSQTGTPANPVGKFLGSTGVLPPPPSEAPAAGSGAGKKEQPAGLVLSAGDARLLRGGTLTPLAARAADLLFTGDSIRTGSKPSTFLFCPSPSSVTLAPSSEARIEAKQLLVAGKISEQRRVASCSLPAVVRAGSASQYYGVSMTRLSGKDSPGAVPRPQLPADLKSELILIDAELAKNATDLAALLAMAVIFEKHNLRANALETYRTIAKYYPDAVWVRGKMFELEEGLAASVTPTKGTTYVVAIGVSKYMHPGIPSLAYADIDAQLVGDFFRSPRGGGVPDTEMILLTNEKATTAAVRISLQTVFQRAAKRDRVVVFIAGQGTVERQRGFFLTFDSDPQDLAATAVPFEELSRLLETYGTRVGTVELYVDVSNAGMIGQIRSAAVNASVEKLGEADANIFGLMASRPKEVAFEGAEFGGGHGAFTYYLVQGLNGGADKDADGTVNVNEIVAYVLTSVAEATGERQHPRDFGTMDNSVVLSDLREPGITLPEPSRSKRLGVVSGPPARK